MQGIQVASNIARPIARILVPILTILALPFVGLAALITVAVIWIGYSSYEGSQWVFGVVREQMKYWDRALIPMKLRSGRDIHLGGGLWRGYPDKKAASEQLRQDAPRVIREILNDGDRVLAPQGVGLCLTRMVIEWISDDGRRVIAHGAAGAIRQIGVHTRDCYWLESFYEWAERYEKTELSEVFVRVPKSDREKSDRIPQPDSESDS